MDFLLGVGGLAATALLFAWTYAAHRAHARWVTWPAASMLACVAVTLAGPVGLGFLIKAALTPLQQWQTLHFWALVVTAGLAVMAVIFAPLLVRQGRRRPTNGAQDYVADNDNNPPATSVAA